MELTEDQVKEVFSTDIDVLKGMPEDEVEFLEQNHFGDMLIEEGSKGNDLFKLWRNLDCNEPGIEVEYHGYLNGYHWETVCIIEIE